MSDEDLIVRLRYVQENQGVIRDAAVQIEKLSNSLKEVNKTGITSGAAYKAQMMEYARQLGITTKQLELLLAGQKGFNRATRDVNVLLREMGVAGKDATQGVSTGLSTLISRYATWATVIETVRKSFMQFADHDKQLRRVAISAGLSVKEMHQLRPFFRELSEKTGESIESMVTGWNTLREYGNLSKQQTMQLFPQVALAAAAIGVSSETLAKTQATLMHNLFIGKDEIGKTNAMLLRATTDYKLNIGETLPMLGTLTEAAAHVGLTGQKGLATILAIIGALKSSHMSGEQAMQGALRILTVMASPDKSQQFLKNKEAMMRMFINAQMQGKNSFAAFMNMVADAENEMGGSFVQRILGTGQRGAYPIYRKLKAALDQIGIDIADLEGVSEEQLIAAIKTRTEGPGAEWDKLKNDFIAMQIELGALLEQLGASTLMTKTAGEIKKLREDIEAIVAFVEAAKKYMGMSPAERKEAGVPTNEVLKGVQAIARRSSPAAYLGAKIVEKIFGKTGKPAAAADAAAAGDEAKLHFSGGGGYGGGGGGSEWSAEEVAALMTEILSSPGMALLRAIKGDVENVLRDTLRDKLGIKDERTTEENTAAVQRLTDAIERLELDAMGGGTVGPFPSAGEPGYQPGPRATYRGSGGPHRKDSGMPRPSAPPTPPIVTTPPAEAKEKLDEAGKDLRDEAWKDIPLPKLEKGGSFKVGSRGKTQGSDSQPVAFMASPGEQVIVQTSQQSAAAAKEAKGRETFWAGVPKPRSSYAVGSLGQSGYQRGDPNYLSNFNHGPLTRLNTHIGQLNVNPAAAADAQNMLNELQAAGVPMGQHQGSHNDRKIAGSNRWSAHTFGGAFDWGAGPNQVKLGQMSVLKEFHDWRNSDPANAAKFTDIVQRNNFISGENFDDLGHLEWGGPDYAKTVAERLGVQPQVPGYSVGEQQVMPPVPNYTNVPGGFNSLDAARAMRSELERPIKINYDTGSPSQFERRGSNDRRVASAVMRDDGRWGGDGDIIA